MSVASDSRPPEAVESSGLPISNDNETTAVPPSNIQYETVKPYTTTMADEVSTQEANVTLAQDEPWNGGDERVAGADKADAAGGIQRREGSPGPVKDTSLASETEVTQTNSTDLKNSPVFEGAASHQDTKEAAATASTTLSAIEAREVGGVEDTKEDEQRANQISRSIEAKGEDRAIVNGVSIPNATTETEDVDKETSHIALSPTQESTAATEQYPRKRPLTIQVDSAKPVEREITLDELSSDQIDKANESTHETDMTSRVSPISVARAVSVAGEESMPGTPVSDCSSDAGARGSDDGSGFRARTKAEKKRAKRLRQKQASREAAVLKAELEAAQIEAPAVPAQVEETKEEEAPRVATEEPALVEVPTTSSAPADASEEPSAAPAGEETAVEIPAVEDEAHKPVKIDESAPIDTPDTQVWESEKEAALEDDAKEAELDREAHTVQEPVQVGAEDSSVPSEGPKVEAASEEAKSVEEEAPKAELAFEEPSHSDEEPSKVESSVEEPVIEDAPKVEVAVEDAAPEVDEAPKVEPTIEQPTPLANEEVSHAAATGPVAEEESSAVSEEVSKDEVAKEEEQPKTEEGFKAQEEPQVDDVSHAEEKELKIEESNVDAQPKPDEPEVEEESKVEAESQVEGVPKAEEELKAEEEPKVEEESHAEEELKAKVEPTIEESKAEDTSEVDETTKVEASQVEEEPKAEEAQLDAAPLAEEHEAVDAPKVEQSEATDPKVEEVKSSEGPNAQGLGIEEDPKGEPEAEEEPPHIEEHQFEDTPKVEENLEVDAPNAVQKSEGEEEPTAEDKAGAEEAAAEEVPKVEEENELPTVEHSAEVEGKREVQDETKIEEKTDAVEEPKVEEVSESVDTRNVEEDSEVEHAPEVDEDANVEDAPKDDEEVEVEELSKAAEHVALEDVPKAKEVVEVEEASKAEPKAEDEEKAEEMPKVEEVEVQEEPKADETADVNAPKDDQEAEIEETPKIEEQVDEAPKIEQVDDAHVIEDITPSAEESAPVEEFPTADEGNREAALEPTAIEAGIVEPVPTPAFKDTFKVESGVSEPVEFAADDTPAAEEVEPHTAVAATAERLDVEPGIVEPLTSPAVDEELGTIASASAAGEQQPITEKLDTALEDLKVEKVAEEIDAALEDLKEQEVTGAEPTPVEAEQVETSASQAVEETAGVKPEARSEIEEPVDVAQIESPAVAEDVKAEETRELVDSAADLPAQPAVEQPFEASEEVQVLCSEPIATEEPTAMESTLPEQQQEPEVPADVPAAQQPVAGTQSVEDVHPEPASLEKEALSETEVAAPAHVEELTPSQYESPVPVAEAQQKQTIDEVVDTQPEEKATDVVDLGNKEVEVVEVAPVEEKAAEVSDLPQSAEISQESEPEQDSIEEDSIEGTGSPIAPITPCVVVEDLGHAQVDEVNVASVPQQAVERPRSPFAPSFSVTTLGGPSSAVEEAVEEQTEPVSPSIAAEIPKSSELSVTPPPRPWTPSYSVHSQGSPLQAQATAVDSEVPIAPLNTETTKAEHASEEPLSEPAETKVESDPAPSVPQTETPAEDVTPAVPAVEQEQEANITAPVPLIAPIPTAGSTYVPSYSVSRQGSPLPKTPEPAEKALPQEDPAAQVPVAAESFWNGVKAVEDEKEKEVKQSNDIQVPKSAILRDALASGPFGPSSINGLAPPKTPTRGRVGSNSSSSRPVPGGWFSPRKGSHDESRPSLETASVLPPISTKNLDVPSSEGHASATPSKKKFCTIM